MKYMVRLTGCSVRRVAMTPFGKTTNCFKLMNPPCEPVNRYPFVHNAEKSAARIFLCPATTHGYQAELSQNHAFDRFLKKNSDRRIVVIEMGAGNAIPTIRSTSERIGKKKYATVIRINPREPSISSPHISMTCGALEGLRNIDASLGNSTFAKAMPLHVLPEALPKLSTAVSRNL